MRQITPRASSHLTYGMLCGVGLYCVFVGHHERSVMCRLVMLVGSVGSRLLRQITPRASSRLTYGLVVFL
ncbi:hypothetical protein [Marinomonas sp. BSi20584]|uniref:hypothetical protein n=1 Tax=Marinomonas sp. BSi20584 TaxID=1594462 RepID=UPI0012FE7C65|nr:hypothetical protein [Marinomonas sp. BSi20584]